VFFNFTFVVLDVWRVQIGSFTLFGLAVQIYTATHPLNAEQRRREEYGKPVHIGSDVWVGGGAIILPGVRIGSRGDRRRQRGDARRAGGRVCRRQSLPRDPRDHGVAGDAAPWTKPSAPAASTVFARHALADRALGRV
jgi:hypothetical protein